MPELPAFVPPMLAVIGAPFDSDSHLFEIKWDGIRAITFVEDGRWRARSRRDHDLAPRYPELDALGALRPGCVLDGELVVLTPDGDDISAVLSREQARAPARVAQMARQAPVTYVVFDLLYEDWEPIVARPLAERRQRLLALLDGVAAPRLAVSDGLVGAGATLFEQAVARGLEGVVGKRLDAPYRVGRRSEAWTKVKPYKQLLCVVLGWVADETGGLRSLVVGTDREGVLTCVGKVGSGLTESLRAELRTRLAALRRDRPIVPAPVDGRWVDPEIYCTVGFVEFTRDGMLRAPVLLGVVN